MKKLVKPSVVNGELTIRPSKSYMQRAVAVAALAHGKTELINPGFSADSRVAIELAKKLGARVQQSDNKLVIYGGNFQFPYDLFCGESGLSARMFSVIAATFNQPIRINGTGSLLKRPQQVIIDTLRQFGVKVTSEDSYLPIEVQGPLHGGTVELDGSFTSQVLSGLLVSLPLIAEDTILKVKNLASIPYTDMTLGTLKSFGVEITHENHETFYIKGGQRPQGAVFSIEPDWSGAAFFMAAAAIAGGIHIEMESTESLQADRAIVDVLHAAQADITVSATDISIRKSALKAFSFDATHCPDLFPPIVVLALYAKGTSKIKGVHRLYHKESNRAKVLQKELGKLGARMHIDDDYLVVEGGPLKSGKIHANYDHRIAMAGAIAALGAEGPIEIDNAESTNKSYPEFFDDLFSLLNNQ